MSESPKTSGDYEVGYGRPPVQSRFQPGQSGNPAGKRKGQPTVAEGSVRPIFRVASGRDSFRP